MEKVRARIQKIGKILQVICTIARWVMVVSALVAAVVMVGTVFSDEVMQMAKKLFHEEGFLSLTENISFLKGLHAKVLIMIAGGLHIFSRMIFAAYLSFFRNFLDSMAVGGNPFTLKNAKRLRRVSYTMLILVFYNFILAVTLFFILLFFSYLFEYGAYLQDRADENSRIQEEMIISFAEITENKSEQTGRHVKRVAEYSRILAEEMGFSREQSDNIYLASMMHDLGKLLVDKEILEKPARLTDEEYVEIKKHSGYGGQLLESVEGDVMQLAKTIALEHHERVDGKEYPYGKYGDEISIESRIVAVADVYDALTSKRSYKESWDDKKAYDEIVKGSGTQFDAEVVSAFQETYERINAVRMKFSDTYK